MSTMSQLGEFLANIQNQQDARTTALEARLATLESKEECGCAETIATLEERLATLEAKEECGCGSYDELLASYEECISALEGNTGGSTEGEGEGGSTEGEGENNIPTSITYDDVLFGIRIYNGEMYVAPIADSNISFRYRKGSSSAVNGTLSNCFEVSTLGYSNGTKYYISKTGHIYDQLSTDGEKYMSNIKITSETFFSVNGQNYSVAPVSGQEYPFVFTLNTPEV